MSRQLCLSHTHAHATNTDAHVRVHEPTTVPPPLMRVACRAPQVQKHLSKVYTTLFVSLGLVVLGCTTTQYLMGGAIPTIISVAGVLGCSIALMLTEATPETLVGVVLGCRPDSPVQRLFSVMSRKQAGSLPPPHLPHHPHRCAEQALHAPGWLLRVPRRLAHAPHRGSQPREPIVSAVTR